jgi:hypothetical protein
MFDISRATNAINATKTVLQSTGPASGLSGIVKGALDGLGGIGGAISGAFSALTKALATPANVSLPLPNVLHDYATYNYVLSFGVLDSNELNFPDSTYRAGISPRLILKSANAEPNNRVQTPYGKFDFFISELTFEGFAGNSRKTGNTNATNIQFKIIEPYSMGLFMQSCQTAAFEAGHKNFRDAPFILIIEFRGNTQSGIPEKIAGATRYLPLKISNISMNVTGAGSTYNVSAFAFNEQALSNQVAKVKTDVTIKGKTVQEVLQTGEYSLQSALNKRQADMVENGILQVADQYIILFPNDIASNASGSAGSGDTENDASATGSAGAGGSVFAKLGVAQSKINDTFVQGDGECNSIGKAKMGFDLERRGTAPMAEMDEVWDSKKGIMNRSKQSIDPEMSDMKFPQNSDINNAINQVILNSEFASKTLDPAALKSDGMRDWWRIDVQTFLIDDDSNLTTTGVKPKLYVYRVVPYEVHASRAAPPNVAPSFEQLKAQAVKEYNYIYTGKNVDVIRFNIDFANGFQQMMAADDGRRNADVRKKEDEAVGQEEDGYIKQPKGDAPPEPGAGFPSQVSYSRTSTSTDGKGGGGTETPGTRVAKLFHDSLINGKDLVNLDIEIVGDPYWLCSSGMGNYTAQSTLYKNLNAEGSVDYQSSEVDAIVNFKTPIDINQATGMYDFGSAVTVQQFSGLYKITTIKNSFKQGQFTQVLSGFRRYGQENPTPVDASRLTTATENIPAPDEYSEDTPNTDDWDLSDVGEGPSDEEIAQNNADLKDFPG